MTCIIMCTNQDCPMQDSCWRLNAPPEKLRQSYQDFKFDYEAFESGESENGCDFYMNMDDIT